MNSSSAEQAGGAGQAIELRCRQCGEAITVERFGEPIGCPKCGEKLGTVAQLDQLLARWYEPRRWRADLVRPSVPFLIEKLWTANGQGERLYQGVSPANTNFDIFRHLVTRVIIKGIDDGWAALQFPPDPLVEDPQYELKILDSERFARNVESQFPDVNWDEAVDADLAAEVGVGGAGGSAKSEGGKKAAKSNRR